MDEVEWVKSRLSTRTVDMYVPFPKLYDCRDLAEALFIFSYFLFFRYDMHCTWEPIVIKPMKQIMLDCLPPLFSSSFPSLRRSLVCPLPHLLGIACPPTLRSKYYTALRFFLFRHDVYCTCCALAYISYIGEVHRGGEIVMMHGL